MTVTGDVAQVHPTLVARVDAAYAEAGLQARCTSGGRTRAEQQALIDGYANRLRWKGGGHRNDPANPYIGYNPANPVGTSRHELQADGWAYAMDLAPAPGSTPALLRVLGSHRLRLPYPGEPWHVEPVEAGLLPAPAPAAAPSEEDDVPLKVATIVPGIDVGHAPEVAVIRALTLLINPKADLSTPAKWDQAVRYFQAVKGLTVDGRVGPETMRVLVETACAGGGP